MKNINKFKLKFFFKQFFFKKIRKAINNSINLVWLIINLKIIMKKFLNLIKLFKT